MSTLVFLSADGDDAMRTMDDHVLKDEPEAVARLAHLLERGNSLLTAWALRIGGTALATCGDNVFVCVPAEALADLPGLMDQYANLVGLTLSVGIGATLPQSQIALKYAKTQGKARIATFEDVPQEAASALDKSEPAVQDMAANGAPAQPAAQVTIQDQLRELANASATAERDRLASDTTAAEEARDRLVTVLQGLQDRHGDLEALVRASPGVADVILDLISTVRDVARTIPGAKAPAAEGELNKATPVGGATKGKVHIKSPVNTVKDGRIKVYDPVVGHPVWREVLSGMVMDRFGNPISAKKPGKYKQ